MCIFQHPSTDLMVWQREPLYDDMSIAAGDVFYISEDEGHVKGRWGSKSEKQVVSQPTLRGVKKGDHLHDKLWMADCRVYMVALPTISP